MVYLVQIIKSFFISVINFSELNYKRFSNFSNLSNSKFESKKNFILKVWNWQHSTRFRFWRFFLIFFFKFFEDFPSSMSSNSNLIMVKIITFLEAKSFFSKIERNYYHIVDFESNVWLRKSWEEEKGVFLFVQEFLDRTLELFQ